MTGWLHALALGLAIGTSGFLQVLMRKGALRGHGLLGAMLHPWTLLAGVLYVSVSLLNVFALQVIPLKTATAWSAVVYVQVLLLSWWLLGERAALRTWLGCGLIVAGIVVFSL